ncbi:oxidoreductase [Luteitalea sp. TBR-22]|uniref:Gfo/Idh/MocA family protein n=1 Tax=Luteitalea sp. TBR-22 TaxID=2802971 RepID=UPI001AFAFB8F|nr:Gfo/Idh/MocA family oxidoreductase [Luteitalea sp. TBR-22]BCS32530.1 oxidoreductase [Luteitalea sp. TBR-22]
MTTIGWGIIGCGDVTEVKSGPGFQKAEGSALVAVMRRTAHLAEDYARRHGVPRWYGDAEALVSDPEVDAVYVATPPDGHLPYTRLAAAHRKPVYVEKPMARTHGECVAMIEACRDAGVPLFTAYYRRALPRFLKVKALLEEGAIGAPRAVAIQLSRRHVTTEGAPPWRVVPEIAGGGLFVDLASHTLDLLDFLLGPISGVTGGAANQGGHYAAEDIVAASLVFDSGVRGSGLWCFTADHDADRVEILGTSGRITFSTFDDVPVVLTRAMAQEAFAIPHPAHVQQPLIQAVVNDLRGLGACPSTGESGARASWVMDRLLRP